MKRALIHSLSAAGIPVMLTACSILNGNQPLTPEQLAYVRTHDVVVQPLPAGYEEPLLVHTRRGKVGADIGISVAATLLTGTIGFSSQSPSGGGPRDRFNNSGQSLAETLKRKVRREAAEEIHTSEPTRILNRLLAERYPATIAPTNDNLTIRVAPVAWHLYYGKGDTFTLEYAGDITLTLPAAKIKRTLWCDHKSEEALTREQWLENDAARIRNYAQETALQCANKALDELQLPRIPNQQTLPQPSTPTDGTPANTASDTTHTATAK